MIGRQRRLPGTRAGRRFLLAVLLLVLSGVLLAPVSRGVEVTHDGADAPGSTLVPVGAAPRSVPGVVVVHGFAGSAALMRTWSLALSHAGFVVVAPDLPGHGRAPSAPQADGGELAQAVIAAAERLRAIPAVDPDRIALLGHSMGAGAVLDAAVARPDLAVAVVAVSPTDADVDAELPRDLLLLAGENERRFVAMAESLLERAGGPRGTPGDGDARALLIVPVVEHVTILFSRTAHEASIDWFAAALGHRPTGKAPAGPLIGWALLAVGVLVLWQAFVAKTGTASDAPVRRTAPRLALPVGGIAATASLVIIVRSVDVAAATGLLVAGEVGLWFLMTGVVWLRFGIRPAPPDARDLGWALLATLVLVGVGASTTLAWSPWWLDGPRIVAAVALSAMSLPFGLASASALHGRAGRRAVLVWAATSVSVVATLGVAAVVVPGLGFLVLILPLLPLVLALTTGAAVGVDRPWASGTATAVLLGWLLAMLFPLA